MKGHQTSWLSGLEGCKRQEKRMSGYSKEDSHIAELLLVDRIFLGTGKRFECNKFENQIIERYVDFNNLWLLLSDGV